MKLALILVMVLIAGCNSHEPYSIENDFKEYQILTYDKTCVQYLVIGMGNGRAGLGPIIGADGRPILDRECVFKKAASKEIENNS